MKLLILFALFTSILGDDLGHLVLLGNSAIQHGAQCLDGTAPGYYFRKGKDSGADKWIVHFQGGGWCYNEKDCYERSKTALGSSKSWPKTMKLSGLLNGKSDVNPNFYNWNVAFLQYCDGASFSGDKDVPIVVNGTKLYFRGKRIAEALYDHLLEAGIRNASEVIQTGCSAGGLSTYLHLDWVRKKLPSHVKLVGMPDAGFFMDLPDVDGRQYIRGLYQYVFKMQNTTNGLNEKCISKTPKEYQWRCFFAQYTYPHIETPIFILNSAYDTWQIADILAPMGEGYKWGKCYQSPADCNATQISDCQGFRSNMISAMQTAGALAPTDKNGAWVNSCWVHCMSLSDFWFYTPKVNGMSAYQLFSDWYFWKANSMHFKYVDCAYPCNQTC